MGSSTTLLCSQFLCLTVAFRVIPVSGYLFNFSRHFAAGYAASLSNPPVYHNVKIRIYETIILPVVLYVCETRSLTLRVRHRLRVFENRVLRRICGPKRDEVIGGWRKLHNEELHNLYCSPNIIRKITQSRMRWVRM
jgi:hypothetical protein